MTIGDPYHFIAPLRHPASGLIPEDAFDLPPLPVPKPVAPITEYAVQFVEGRPNLVFTTTTNVAVFNDFEDARSAAKALNEHKGY
jgi:hypothetical protein